MILLCGIPSEAPLAMVARQLDQLSIPYLWFNQRFFSSMALTYEVVEGTVTGSLTIDRVTYGLDEIEGVYIRLMDDRLLPEIAEEPANSPTRARCRALHDCLIHWTEIASARVVNRAEAQGSNFSKPYQAQLIMAQGFAVPETLITNDPDLVLAFSSRHRRVIYKSISGVRSIVQVLTEDDLRRLDQIRWCPVQFQAFIEGTNVRVHTVGDEVFATAVSTSATDYRYAHQQDQGHAPVELHVIDLPRDVTSRCVSLARALGLAFAGIDLKITPDNEVFCFEVNPSPAYTYYEDQTGQPISLALARYLAGEHG